MTAAAAAALYQQATVQCQTVLRVMSASVQSMDTGQLLKLQTTAATVIHITIYR